MSNFQFLKTEWPSLFTKIKKAEERVYTEPVSAASYGRLLIEECTHLIYEYEYIELPYNQDIYNLLSQEEIRAIIPIEHQNALTIARKIGNAAAHYGKKTSAKDALISIKHLFGFLKWFALNYAEESPDLPNHFEETLIPKVGATERKIKTIREEQEAEYSKLKAEIDRLQEEKAAILQLAQESEMALSVLKDKEEFAKKAIQEKRKERTQKISSEFSEAETRRHLIDVDLKEVGWNNLAEGYELEYPVHGMPITKDNPKGNGYADYVLWNDDGKPLAVIEAKRTTKSVEVGKHQAFLYADCLEQMHGQRPVIFYTNGYETKLWDDTFYSTPRRVYGFYSKEELQWMIQKRESRKDIRNAKSNIDIAGYPYQIEAIQRVSEVFCTDGDKGLKGNKRSALLVMATGSGKTRTAAAIVDLLFKNNWVKRVLFLADRNALVTQAKDSFADHLPELSSIDLTEEKENNNTRLVFSTYPSMMHRIDNLRSSDERFYGVGHFDLIIVDEAHRSVYNRYRSIFEYFDAMVVGLTATPKDSIDHNTFELFGCSNDDPTFSFELNQAVPEYLNTYNNISINTKFLREGIKYNDLSEKEKGIYEESFSDKTTGLFPEEIKANAMNKWLFNKDTVNKVLDALMDEGLKIEGGDKIGRTIIFAVNQKHADFIVQCFTERYPEKPSGFIETIHNQVSHAASLIKAFCDHHKENNPQIAVSVDMLDTGIDAPRILNLVFFKIVRSYAKFWQMIGRGTRLCPDVFGPNSPKDSFLVFDVCQNFEFFDINKKGKEANKIKPITQDIFDSRVQLSRLLAETGEIENIDLANNLLDMLHNLILHLDRNRFQVDMSLRYVDEFSERNRWNNLSSDDVHIIESHLSELPIPESINEVARRFDLMMIKLQLAELLMLNRRKFHENLTTIAEQLSTKYTIPAVLRSQELIENLKNPEFYNELSQKRIESIRTELRELVQYLEAKGREPIYTDIEDSDINISITESKPKPISNSLYKKRVESFIREHKQNIAISKLSSNKPITEQELNQLENILFDDDERGTKDDFIKIYGEQPLGEFVRSIIGLDEKAAQEAFAVFLQSGNLRADQMTFVNNIITYLSINGTLDKNMLFKAPFTDINDQGLLGVFETGDAVKIIHIIDEINDNVMVG